jgi:hypothetical protein
MAMILEQFEVRRPAHAILRRAITDQPVTFGRALTNDIVLDDPFVDAHHAMLVVEPDGALVLTDLGSVNRLELLGTGRVDRVALVPGVVVRMGRCSFRVRDSAEEVPEAMPLPGNSALAHSRLEDRRWTIGVLGAVALVSAWSTWNASTTRDGAVETLLMSVVALLLVAGWAGFWALVSRLVTRRPSFLVHATIGGLTWLALLVTGWFRGWADFLWPMVWTMFAWVEVGLMVVVMLFAIVTHLEYASNLPARRRWAGVLWGVVGMTVFGGAIRALQDERFSDVPEYSAEIRLLPARLIPAGTIAEFNRATMAAQKEADAAVSGPE